MIDFSHLYAYDEQGLLSWQFSDKGISSSLIIDSDGIIYFATAQGVLYGIAGNNGGPAQQAWPMLRRNAQRTGRMSDHVEPPTEYETFTLMTSVMGSGTVTGDTVGIQCTNECTQMIESGTSVSLTASAAEGWTFSGWEGACSGTDACTVMMTADQSVKATFTEPPIEVSEIIIDNLDANTEQTGQWPVSSASGAYANQSVYSNANGTFRWIPELSASGAYEIYTRWTYHRNRRPNVPYRIQHTGGIDTVIVDQSDPALASAWQSLGIYLLDSSTYIEVSSENGQANADAVRLVPVADAPVRYTLTTSIVGSGMIQTAGSGTATGHGINCGGDCTESYTSGQQ